MINLKQYSYVRDCPGFTGGAVESGLSLASTPAVKYHLFFFVTLLILISLPSASHANEILFENILGKMQKEFDFINSYKCVLEAYVANGTKSERAVYQYFFEKPQNVRMEILQGNHPGTVLILKENKVRVKVGSGPLSLFSFTFDPDSSLVVDIRGNGLARSDWGFFISQHLKWKDLIGGRQTGEEILDGKDTMIFELTSKAPAITMSVASEKLWIDKNTYMPVRYLQFDSGGRLIQDSFYRNVQINTAIKGDLFVNFKN